MTGITAVLLLVPGLGLVLMLMLVVGLGLGLRKDARQQQYPRQEEQNAGEPGMVVGICHDKPTKLVPGTGESVPGITGY
ncbi:MAG TPA: hypothetical protein VGA66_10015 [Mycobacterium sp.]